MLMHNIHSAEDQTEPLKKAHYASLLFGRAYYFFQCLPERPEDLTHEEIQTIADIVWVVEGIVPSGNGSWARIYDRLKDLHQMRGAKLFGLPQE